MLSLDAVPDQVRSEIASALVSLVFLDGVLRDLGANPRRPPAFIGNSRISQLAWGVDSMVAAARLLFCGQVAGAAAIARNQVEVWTQARALLSDTTKLVGESESEFIARAWSRPLSAKRKRSANATLVFDWPDQQASAVEPDMDHRHVRLEGGSELCPAAIWGAQSELLHGREFSQASFWDASCLDNEEFGDSGAAIELVLDGLRLSMFQIRAELRVLALDAGFSRSAQLLSTPMDGFSEAGDEDPQGQVGVEQLRKPAGVVSPTLWFLAPLSPGEGLSTDAMKQMSEAAEAFELVLNGRRPAGRLYRDDELVTVAFGWHRFRSAVTAQAALDREALVLRDRSDLRFLSGRGTVWVLVSEAAALAGLWLPAGSRRDAICLAASALRSSWWMWLEDDDRSMTMLRTVLEQVARGRTWRRRPEKAGKLEKRSTPRDWLEAAGWKRLGPLNAAVGGFAHLTAKSDWGSARSLLMELQDAPDPQDAPFTARRSALELVTSLLAMEICEQVRELSPSIGDELRVLFHEVGAFPDEVEKFIENRMNFIGGFRPAITSQSKQATESVQATISQTIDSW